MVTIVDIRLQVVAFARNLSTDADLDVLIALGLLEPMDISAHRERHIGQHSLRKTATFRDQ
jgi:hypothetical protein